MTVSMASASLHLASQLTCCNKFKALDYPEFIVSCFTRFGDRPLCSSIGSIRRYA